MDMTQSLEGLMETREWLYLSIRERYWWCQCHDMNPCWPMHPKTEQDSGICEPPAPIMSKGTQCIVSPPVTTVSGWPGWHPRGPLYFLLATKQS